MGGKHPPGYMAKYVAKQRAALFVDKACVICDSTERLELDHIVPEEKTSSQIWTWGKERREAEIAKCQVLCRKHHQEKTRAYIQVKFAGEGAPSSKLKNQQVLSIRERYAAGGVTQMALAVEFGVAVRTVNLLINRKTWKHI